MTITPMPATTLTRGTRIMVSGTAYWVRDTTTGDDGGTVQVIGRPAAVAL